jgi:hypothetical protein
MFGTWSGVLDAETVAFVFRQDGTFAMSIASASRSRDFFGTYSRDKDTVELRQYHNQPEMFLTFEILILTKDEMKIFTFPHRQVIAFRRVSSSASIIGPAEARARTPEGQAEIRRAEAKVEEKVENNVRFLKAAADFYFVENGGTTVGIENLVGPTKYMKELSSVSGEHYPQTFTQGGKIKVTEIHGYREIEYSFPP